MGFRVFRLGRRASLLVSIALLMLPGGLGVAAARPSLRPASPVQSSGLSAPPRAVAGARLVVSQVSSAPAGARSGGAYVLGATVRNDGSADGRGRLIADLLHVGDRPVAIGSTAVGLAAHESGAYRVGIRLPRALPDGSYALIACVARGRSGALSCATAERHLQIGQGAPVAHSAVSGGFAGSSLLVGRAFALAVRGPRVSRDRQRRLHERPHRRVPRLRRATRTCSCRGRTFVLTDRATQCLTDFSLDFERTSPNADDGPNMTRQLGARERPAGELHVRAADVSRRPERPERPRPAGARGLAAQPGRRARRQPAAAGLLAASLCRPSTTRTRWTAPSARRTSS